MARFVHLAAAMAAAPRRKTYRLSILVILLQTLSSGAGLLFHDLYRDNPLVAASWSGNDLVTLVVATPLPAVALLGAWGGSRRADPVWTGMLAYTLYNSAVYLFGAAFNSLFLVYALLVALSGIALAFGLVSLDATAPYREVQSDLPVRWVSGFMMVVAVALGGFHVILSLQYVATGQVPVLIDAVGLHTNLIAALDLIMVVPVALLPAGWLWQERPWGYVWATVWAVKGTVYMIALSAATMATFVVGPSDDWVQLFLWVPLSVGCLVAGGVLLRSLRPDPRNR